MDPFEDFQFQPLTEGLGFHRKTEKLKEDVKRSTLQEDFQVAPLKTAKYDTTLDDLKARPTSESISDLMASLPPSLDFLEGEFESKENKRTALLDEKANETQRPQIFHPLGKETSAPTLNAPSSSTITSTIQPSLNRSPFSASAGAAAPLVTKAAGTLGLQIPTSTPSLNSQNIAKAPMNNTMPLPGSIAASALRDSVGIESHSEGKQRSEIKQKELIKAKAVGTAKEVKTLEGLEEIATAMGSAILDGAVVLGFGTLALVAILSITKIDIVGLMSHPQTQDTMLLNLMFLYLAVMQIYMLTSRGFFGCSLGDWSFDVQVGTSEQQKQARYPMQILWRSLLNTVTGIVVLPILSLMSGRDLLSSLSGVHLFRKR